MRLKWPISISSTAKNDLGSSLNGANFLKKKTLKSRFLYKMQLSGVHK